MRAARKYLKSQLTADVAGLVRLSGTRAEHLTLRSRFVPSLDEMICFYMIYTYNKVVKT
jgi:hypothetical protein